MAFCPKCGKKNDPEVEFCKFCRAKIPRAKPSHPLKAPISRGPRPKYPAPPPLGVAIVAVVESVLGALYASVSITTMARGGWLIMLQFVVGIIALAAGWGLWDLKKWAWNFAMVFTFVDILVHVRYFLLNATIPISMIITVAIEVIIPVYLAMPHTRAYFGEGVQQERSS